MLIEITNINEISDAQNLLKAQLEREYPHVQLRKIGWPAGAFDAYVRFSKKNGESVSWWYGGVDIKNKKLLNLFGHGDYENPKESLLIDLQFNFPRDKFSRMTGGVFVKEPSSNEIILGHRGIVTRGKSRIPKDLIFKTINLTKHEVVSDIKPGVVEILLVASIQKKGIGQEAQKFSEILKELKNKIASSLDTEPINTSVNDDYEESGQDIEIRLNGFVEEFSGLSSMKGRTNSTRICRHGAIVGELHKRVLQHGKAHNPKPIDLVIESKDTIRIYEVKTNAMPQSIYTAIGQLLFNGAVLGRQYPSKAIMRYLVLPICTSQKRVELCKSLGLEFISFTDKNEKVTFKGLE